MLGFHLGRETGFVMTKSGFAIAKSGFVGKSWVWHGKVWVYDVGFSLWCGSLDGSGEVCVMLWKRLRKSCVL